MSRGGRRYGNVTEEFLVGIGIVVRQQRSEARQITAHDPVIISGSSYVLMGEPDFRRGMKRLPAHNLTFEGSIVFAPVKSIAEPASGRRDTDDSAEPAPESVARAAP